MTLLHCNSQWSKPILEYKTLNLTLKFSGNSTDIISRGWVFYLSGKALVCPIGEQKLNNIVMVLLCSHVQRCESILALNVDGCTMLDQQSHYLLLAR